MFRYWRITICLVLLQTVMLKSCWGQELPQALSSPIIGPLNKEQIALIKSIQFITPEEQALLEGHHSDNTKCSCGIANTRKIVGGTEAGLHEFPWMAFILIWKPNGLFLCGGSIITDRHVLTAAHCMDNADENGTELFLGGMDTWFPNNTVAVNASGYKIHPNFNNPPFQNDIAIITLSQAVKFNARIRPICLPTDKNTDYVGKTATVAGWGKLGPDEDWSRLLMKVNVPIINNSVCQRGYGEEAIISSHMLCAGVQYPNGTVQDVCVGDSGGPLMISKENKFSIIGTVSFGYKTSCGTAGVPGAYARVDHFLKFIRQNTRSGNKCRN